MRKAEIRDQSVTTRAKKHIQNLLKYNQHFLQS